MISFMQAVGFPSRIGMSILLFIIAIRRLEGQRFAPAGPVLTRAVTRQNPLPPAGRHLRNQPETIHE